MYSEGGSEGMTNYEKCDVCRSEDKLLENMFKMVRN